MNFKIRRTPMNIIAAADKSWGIGKDGQLLDSIPEDMKFFREKTVGKVVIMGKNTFLSFPGQKALPKRLNIILTHDAGFSAENALVCADIESALKEARKEYDDADIFFIGGESVYREAVKYCDTAYITKIKKTYPADRFLVDFDSLTDWHIESENSVMTEKGIEISFVTYRKIS